MQCNQDTPGELRQHGGPGSFVSALLEQGYRDLEAMHGERVMFFEA